MVMEDATVAAAVPTWHDKKPPPPRTAQLGDFGLGFPLNNFKKHPGVLPITTAPVKKDDGGGTGWLVAAPHPNISKDREEKLGDKPRTAMDRSVRSYNDCWEIFMIYYLAGRGLHCS